MMRIITHKAKCPVASLEEFDQDNAGELQHTEDLQTMARELSNIREEAIDNNIGLESIDGIHLRYMNAGVESVMIAAVAAAGVALAGILYKVYRYFANKKNSDNFDDAIGLVEDMDDLDDTKLTDAVSTKADGTSGPVNLNSNVALVALAMKQNGDTLLHKVPSPKEFLATVELMPSIADVDAASGKISEAQVAKLDAQAKEQYEYLERFCKRFKLDTPDIKRKWVVGAPTKGYADAAAQLLMAIAKFAGTENDKQVIKPETVAREFFSSGMADTLKRAKRETEDLEEYADKLADLAEKSKGRLEDLKRKNSHLDGKQASDAIVKYMDYLKAVTMMYKTNVSIQLRVNNYVKGIANEVKDLVRE